MSYDCTILHKDGSPYMVAFAPAGGTYRLDPPSYVEAWFNITYNYSKFIYKVLDGGIPGLDGKCVDDTIAAIRTAVSRLEGEPDEDYWKPTEGNAKKALQGLLVLAVQCPGGIWEIS